MKIILFSSRVFQFYSVNVHICDSYSLYCPKEGNAPAHFIIVLTGQPARIWIQMILNQLQGIIASTHFSLSSPVLPCNTVCYGSYIQISLRKLTLRLLTCIPCMHAGICRIVLSSYYTFCGKSVSVCTKAVYGNVTFKYFSLLANINGIYKYYWG